MHINSDEFKRNIEGLCSEYATDWSVAISEEKLLFSRLQFEIPLKEKNRKEQQKHQDVEVTENGLFTNTEHVYRNFPYYLLANQHYELDYPHTWVKSMHGVTESIEIRLIKTDNLSNLFRYKPMEVLVERDLYNNWNNSFSCSQRVGDNWHYQPFNGLEWLICEISEKADYQEAKNSVNLTLLAYLPVGEQYAIRVCVSSNGRVKESVAEQFKRFTRDIFLKLMQSITIEPEEHTQHKKIQATQQENNTRLESREPFEWPYFPVNGYHELDYHLKTPEMQHESYIFFENLDGNENKNVLDEQLLYSPFATNQENIKLKVPQIKPEYRDHELVKMSEKQQKALLESMRKNFNRWDSAVD